MSSPKTIEALLLLTHVTLTSIQNRFHSIQGNAPSASNLVTYLPGWTQRDIDRIFSNKATFKKFKHVTTGPNGSYYELRNDSSRCIFFLDKHYTPQWWRDKSRRSFVGFGTTRHKDILLTNLDMKDLLWTDDEATLAKDYSNTSTSTSSRGRSRRALRRRGGDVGDTGAGGAGGAGGVGGSGVGGSGGGGSGGGGGGGAGGRSHSRSGSRSRSRSRSQGRRSQSPSSTTTTTTTSSSTTTTTSSSSSSSNFLHQLTGTTAAVEAGKERAARVLKETYAWLLEQKIEIWEKRKGIVT
jgi:hypothetical protein